MTSIGSEDTGDIGSPDVEPPEFLLTLTSPSQLQTFTGPGGGVPVPVTGTVYVDASMTVTKLSVSLDEKKPKLIDPIPAPRSSDNAIPFTTTFDVTTSGNHRIEASVTTNTGKKRTVTIHIAVALDAASKAPPTLVVDTPLDNTVVAAQFSDPTLPTKALVLFAGSATSAPGTTVSSVTIVIDADDVSAVVAAPKAAGDWSAWSAEQELAGLGKHQAVVTCKGSDGGCTTLTFTIVLSPAEPRLWLYSKIMIVETLRLTNFLGRYGPGRVVRTLSLLPGESTTISVRTYSSSTETSKNASSIFDHVEDATTDEFNSSIADEQTDKNSTADSQDWQVSANASATWGWGNANISGSYKSGANSAREDVCKNVTNAAQKHAAQSSSKRDIQVNAETQREATAGEDQTIVRQIKNINVGRTLNFLFRQMNQEFISLLHLVDARVGYVSAFLRLSDGQRTFEYREATLPQILDLLRAVVRPQYVSQVLADVFDVLANVSDYSGTLQTVVETVTPKDSADKEVPSAQYTRFNRSLKGSWEDPDSGFKSPTVSGVVLTGTKIVLRTDGVAVEASLGQCTALDSYSIGLQDASVEQRKLDNAQRQQLIDLVNSPDPDKLDAWQKTHPDRLPASLTLAAAATPPSGGGGAPSD
jgi:hypothetical protein